MDFVTAGFIDAEVFDPSSRTWTRHFSPTDAKTRIEWLDHQRDEDLENNFKTAAVGTIDQSAPRVGS